MLKKFKLLKDQRGLTLIELLVVVVILGIIAAIAVPSVGGLIENSRKDAMVGNAQQAISAAKLYAASTNDATGTVDIQPGGTNPSLVDLGYLDPIKNPWGGTETLTGSVVIAKTGTVYSYTVTLTATGGSSITGRTEAQLTRELAFLTD